MAKSTAKQAAPGTTVGKGSVRTTMTPVFGKRAGKRGSKRTGRR